MVVSTSLTQNCSVSLFPSPSPSVSAAHVIVPFTQRLLARDLPALASLDSHMAVCGAFIFVCRQMYNTCEGLQALRPYSLHESIAATWRKVTALGLSLPEIYCITFFCVKATPSNNFPL